VRRRTLLAGPLVLLAAACGGAQPTGEPASTDELAARAAAAARQAAREGGPPPTASSTPDRVTGARAAGIIAPPPTPARPPSPTATARPAPLPTPLPTQPPQPTPAPPSPTPPIAFAKEKPITYVAIGASDTVGVGAPTPSRDGWVPLLHRRLPAGSKLVNLGVSGARLADAVQGQLPKALEAKPELVTVWNVVNDLNANVDLSLYERDLDRLVRDLTSRTPARVLVGNCPDLGRVPAYTKLGIPPEELRREVARWNQVIARVAQKYPAGAYVVDLYARSAEVEIDETMVAGDDFHPSAKGYSRLAAVFWEFMVANRLVAA
jgi:acyl-CoA thioesterase-1